eukprot:scaffold44506_cov19-Tisochrysis_lutea.AAC.1
MKRISRTTATPQEYDEVFKLSRRKFIPPNFAELRHVVNIAQVRGWKHAKMNGAPSLLECNM